MTDALLQNALALRRAGRLAEAAEVYAQILRGDPRHFEALHALGILCYQSGRLDEAERLIGEAIAVRPGAADAVYNRACLQQKLNRPEEALASFDAAIALKPDYIEALVNRGALLAKVNRPVEALASFDRVVALRPSIPEAWANRAGALLALGRFEESVASCDRALALRPGYPDAVRLRSEATAAMAEAAARRPSLAVFEHHVAERAFGNALQSALRVLHAIDEAFGRLDGVATGEISPDQSEELRIEKFCTRFVTAFGQLLIDPALELSFADFERLAVHHRWIDLVFSLSEFRNSDRFLAAIGGNGDSKLLRFLILRSLNSGVRLDLESIWQANPNAAATAFLHYLSSRYVFQRPAFELRERLLEWLPVKLASVKLEPLTISRLADSYMHCSYAVTPKKHAIKAEQIAHIRRALLEAGCTEILGRAEYPADTRPTVVVVGELLSPGHSIHRTHSRAIASLKERFRVVGAVYPDPKGTPIENFFDQCIDAAGADFFELLKRLSEDIAAQRPALIFYTGVGMVPQFLALASLRLAPIQCVSHGHSATTMSPAMDYFILPEDFIGSPRAFSETVLGLPKAAMPYAPRPLVKKPTPPPDGTIRVAVPASVMKLNPLLFETLAQILARVRRKTEVQFFPKRRLARS